MRDRSRDIPETGAEPRKDWMNKLSGGLIILGTVIIAFMLITSAVQAYCERNRALDELRELEGVPGAKEAQLEKLQQERLKLLDPDYERAVYRRKWNIKSPGEDVLPIYDGPEES